MQNIEQIKAFLLWARENNFLLNHFEFAELKIEVTDLELMQLEEMGKSYPEDKPEAPDTEDGLYEDLLKRRGVVLRA